MSPVKATVPEAPDACWKGQATGLDAPRFEPPGAPATPQPPQEGRGHRLEEISIEAPGREEAQPPSALSDPVRSRMEKVFGEDLSSVRLHLSAEPKRHRARGFARGEEIHLLPHLFEPHRAEGQRVLGHELAHVVQQRNAAKAGGQAAVGETFPLEAEAHQAGESAARGAPVQVLGKGAGVQALTEKDDPEDYARAGKEIASLIEKADLGPRDKSKLKTRMSQILRDASSVEEAVAAMKSQIRGMTTDLELGEASVKESSRTYREKRRGSEVKGKEPRRKVEQDSSIPSTLPSFLSPRPDWFGRRVSSQLQQQITTPAPNRYLSETSQGTSAILLEESGEGVTQFDRTGDPEKRGRQSQSVWQSGSEVFGHDNLDPFERFVEDKVPEEVDEELLKELGHAEPRSRKGRDERREEFRKSYGALGSRTKKLRGHGEEKARSSLPRRRAELQSIEKVKRGEPSTLVTAISKSSCMDCTEESIESRRDLEQRMGLMEVPPQQMGLLRSVDAERGAYQEMTEDERVESLRRRQQSGVEPQVYFPFAGGLDAQPAVTQQLDREYEHFSLIEDTNSQPAISGQTGRVTPNPRLPVSGALGMRPSPRLGSLDVSSLPISAFKPLPAPQAPELRDRSREGQDIPAPSRLRPTFFEQVLRGEVAAEIEAPTQEGGEEAGEEQEDFDLEEE